MLSSAGLSVFVFLGGLRERRQGERRVSGASAASGEDTSATDARQQTRVRRHAAAASPASSPRAARPLPMRYWPRAASAGTRGGGARAREAREGEGRARGGGGGGSAKMRREGKKQSLFRYRRENNLPMGERERETRSLVCLLCFACACVSLSLVKEWGREEGGGGRGAEVDEAMERLALPLSRPSPFRDHPLRRSRRPPRPRRTPSAMTTASVTPITPTG